MVEIGPQHDNDDAFTARMRLHQSWWRAKVLGVPCGVGPHASSAARSGSMLTAGDGARGLNFLSPEIAAYALNRQSQFPRGIKKHRLVCNMLSSQPMCFNLFGAAALDESIALPLVSALIERRDLQRVVRVIVEHEPAPRREHLGDSTSFDAFVEVEDQRGELGFVGIETKLTEPFSQDRYPIAEGSGSRRWVDHERAPWRVPSVASLEAVAVNQLFRDHALAVAACHRVGSPYKFGALAVVRHPDDPSCAASMATYGNLVRLDADVPLLDLPLDDAVRRLRPVVSGTRWAAWLDAFNRRYVDLRESAEPVP